MPEALPEFQLASELGPSPSREEELEGRVQDLMGELEELRGRETEQQAGLKCPPAMKPEERQALLQVISDLDARLKLAELQSENKVKDLETTVRKQGEQIELLRDGILRLQDLVSNCTQLQENHRAVISKLMDEISALKGKKAESEINKARAEKIREYLHENGTTGKFLNKRTGKFVEGKAARFEVLRGHLVIDKYKLNRALHSLFQTYPGEYCTKKINKKSWVLVERPKL